MQEGPDGIHKHARASQYYAAVSKLDKVEMKYGYLTGDKSAPNEKNVDTQICADMVTSAALGEFDTAILVSSDGDFQSAITNSKKLGKRVEILFFKGHCSGALRQMCDLARKARRSHFTKITGV